MIYLTYLCYYLSSSFTAPLSSQSRLVKSLYFSRKVFQECEDIFDHRKYVQDLARIASPTYRPTSHDVISARADEPSRPKVQRDVVFVNGIALELYTAHGFKPKEPRWARYFRNVNSVAYVAPLTKESGSTLDGEDADGGNMFEHVEVFRNFCASRSKIAQASTLLFLGRPDLTLDQFSSSGGGGGGPRDYHHHEDIVPTDSNQLLSALSQYTHALQDFSNAFVHVKSHTRVPIPMFVLDSIMTILMTENLRRSGFLGSPEPETQPFHEHHHMSGGRHGRVPSTVETVVGDDLTEIESVASSITLCDAFN